MCLEADCGSWVGSGSSISSRSEFLVLPCCDQNRWDSRERQWDWRCPCSVSRLPASSTLVTPLPRVCHCVHLSSALLCQELPHSGQVQGSFPGLLPRSCYPKTVGLLSPSPPFMFIYPSSPPPALPFFQNVCPLVFYRMITKLGSSLKGQLL